MMGMWMHKPTLIAGRGADGDRVVLRHAQAVGRVSATPAVPGTQGWQWATLTCPAFNGRADSQADALDALRQVIQARWPDDVAEVPLAGG